MYRETIVDNDDYTFDLSYEHGELFAHIDVYNYNDNIFDRMMDDWFDIEEALVSEGFTKVFGLPKRTGLVERMGWLHVCDVDFRDKKQGVYVWDLRSYQS